MVYLYLLLNLIILWLEYKKYKNFISPACLSIISYSIAIVLAWVGRLEFEYLGISDNVFFKLMIASIVTWIPSIILRSSYIGYDNRKLFEPKFQNYFSFFIVCFFLIGGLFFALRTGSIGSEQFESNYSRGIFAHIRNLYSVIITYLICFSNKSKKTLFYILIGIILIFLSGTKYHLFFVFFPVFLLILKNPTKKKLFYLFIVSIIVCILFFTLNYFIGFLLRGVAIENFNRFILNHLLKYISGGVIGFSEYLNNVPPCYETYRWVDACKIENTNVYTLLGYLYIKYKNLDYFVLFFISFMGYLFYYISIYMKRLNHLFLTYCYLFGIPFLLSFFSSYYGLSNIWEMAFFSLFLELFLNANNYNFILKN